MARDTAIPLHKQMAAGKGYKTGGAVKPMLPPNKAPKNVGKTVTKVKGMPCMKKGGAV